MSGIICLLGERANRHVAVTKFCLGVFLYPLFGLSGLVNDGFPQLSEITLWLFTLVVSPRILLPSRKLLNNSHGISLPIVTLVAIASALTPGIRYLFSSGRERPMT